MLRTGVIAAIIFVIAHFAMLVGVTTPEKFYFDEVHYVPAARQMLEPVMREPMLNPMHPPLAKQFIALSIHSFGVFNQMLFVQSRIAILDIFALSFSLFAIAAFIHGFRKERPHSWFALAGVGFGLSAGCKWSGLFVLAGCVVARRWRHSVA